MKGGVLLVYALSLNTAESESLIKVHAAEANARNRENHVSSLLISSLSDRCDGRMDDLCLYILFNSISVTVGQ